MRVILVLLCCLAADRAAAATVIVDCRVPGATEGQGSDTEPYRSLARAVRDLHAGDTVRVRSGTYRETVRVETSGTADLPITIAAEPGAHVVIDGSDVITDLKRAGDGRWFAPWPHQFMTWSKTNAHPDDHRHEIIGRAEQVMMNGYALLQVLKPE